MYVDVFFCVRVLNNTKMHAAEFAESQTLTSLLILAFMWASLATCTTDDASFGFQRMLLFPPEPPFTDPKRTMEPLIGSAFALKKMCVYIRQ